MYCESLPVFLKFFQKYFKCLYKYSIHSADIFEYILKYSFVYRGESPQGGEGIEETEGKHVWDKQDSMRSAYYEGNEMVMS